jgi:hypothetical protein
VFTLRKMAADGAANERTKLELYDDKIALLGGNVGIGTTTPSEELDVDGDINWSGSLYRGGNLLLHFAGTDSTFLGTEAGTAASTGAGNTAFGNKALRDNTSGLGNTAVGRSALRENSTGDANTAVGDAALVNNTTGSSNTAVGDGALIINTDGAANTAIGDDAMYYNDSGSNNTAVGYFALEDNLNSNNTAVGYDAMKNLSNGSDNVALGHSAGANVTAGSHNVYISNGGPTSESNTTRIGDTNQTRTFISGIHGVIVAGGVQVVVDSNGQLGNAGVSSRVFKRDVVDIGDRSSVLYDLRPVSFRYLEEFDPDGFPQFGLIAEEVAKVAPELVFSDEEGNPQIVRYEQLVPLLLNEVQELRASNEALWARLEALEQEVRD